MQYIYGIESNLNINSVSINNIQLSPFKIEIKKGIVIQKTKKIITYTFDDNKKETWETKNNTKILSIFHYWIQNSGQVLKGSYCNIYEILPNIGGLIQLIHLIFYSINYIYNKYITIIDCNKAIFKMINADDPKEMHTKKAFLDHPLNKNQIVIVKW